ncbi:hypothetical protein KO495_06630 [Colwellia sp. D2M02]|uniref:VC2046/SO_2500 family protein n=1 Tax=Colwellia sp. D2M02 TaxID=2841562 RepID=UPI001C094EA4|nr:VC2046/SO_2500 family protein [Colwellia sp. D2M02]MBU2892999.1 hypothetical protein [Colwellia sp. D2M02]
MAVNTSQNYTSSVNDAATSPLLHELQLGEQLNDCIQQTRRADFSLMLAMLAEDVREHSQFCLPQAQALSEKDTSNKALRKQFQLPETAPLALQSMNEIASFNQVEAVLANDLASIRLANALTPKPLSFRDNKHHIASDVIANTSVYCQTKLAQAAQQNRQTVAQKPTTPDENSEPSLLNHELPLNVEGWLNGIEKSLVQAPLVN